MEPESHPPQSALSVPMAIVVAGLLISGAVFFSRGSAGEGKGLTREALKMPETAAVASAPSPTALRPIGVNDHIRGNPDAQVLVIEYSDPECPFCKRFHETMQQIIADYGKSGKVAWVYRHFPLAQLHSKALNEAEATECAAELGGNNGFWNYIDELFRITPSNDGLPPSELPAIAERVGLDRAKFEKCLAGGVHEARVADDYANAVATGGTGTPWSIVQSKTGERTTINGAQPYAQVKETIDKLLLLK